MSEGKLVGSDNPTIRATLNKMVRDGFQKETILQTIGSAIGPHDVDAAMIAAGRSGAPIGHAEERHRNYVGAKREETTKKRREWTDEMRQKARDRMLARNEAAKKST
jgi:hypothetical protein